MTRKVLLLTIGADPLPSVTPVVPVDTTDAVDAWTAPPLAAPTTLTVAPMVDAGHLAWTYTGPADAEFIVQLATDSAGVATGWASVGTTRDRQYLVALENGARWVRVYAMLNGRMSDPSNEVLVTPVDGTLVEGTATAVSELQSRVTTAEGTITAQSSQITTLNSSLTINRSVAGRTPLVFRQGTAPAISGTRYNRLLHTALFSHAAWSKTAGVAASTAGDPEGYLQAWRITPSADGQYARQDVSGLGSVAGRTFTFSVWLRADTAHDATLQLVAPTSGATQTLHVAVTNTFQRFNLTHTFGAETDTALRVEIYPKKLGVAGAPNHFVDAFGPQLQEGALSAFQRVSVATDYDGNGIPPLSEWYNTADGNKQSLWVIDTGAGSASWTLSDDSRIAATASATAALDTRVTSAEGTISSHASSITSIEAALPGKASVSAVEALDARVVVTENGVTSYNASYTLTLNANGKISGFKSVNNGVTSVFEVQADVFRVVRPEGGDSLTWTDSVLTALKGTKSVKLGAGFGASSNLVLWYGADGTTATRTVQNAEVSLTTTGPPKLGGTNTNFASGWDSGANATATYDTAAPAAVTFSVTAGVFVASGHSVSYAASSAVVSQARDTTVKYYLYYADPGFAGGSVALGVSTDSRVAYTNTGHIYIGPVTVTVPAAASSGTGGSGGGQDDGACPHVDAWVLSHRGPVRAGEVIEGDMLLLCDPDTGIECWGRVSYSRHKRASGVRLVMDGGGTLTCSRSAPIPTELGYRAAPDTLGRHVPVRRGERHAAPAVVEVVALGLIDVQHITVGDRCFWAGDDSRTYLLHHNIKVIP